MTRSDIRKSMKVGCLVLGIAAGALKAQISEVGNPNPRAVGPPGSMRLGQLTRLTPCTVPCY